MLYDATSWKGVIDGSLCLQGIEVLQEPEPLLQNTEDTLNILSNGFQLCTPFHDWRTRNCILVWVYKDRSTKVSAVANEVDTSMNSSGSICSNSKPRLGVQPAIPFQQVHHSLVGSDNVFVVSGCRGGGGRPKQIE